MKSFPYIAAVAAAVFIANAWAQTASTPRTDGRQGPQKVRTKVSDMSDNLAFAAKRREQRAQRTR